MVYHDVLPMQNIGGAWAQIPGSDIFSSLGHPYSLGMSSDKLHLNLTGFFLFPVHRVLRFSSWIQMGIRFQS